MVKLWGFFSLQRKLFCQDLSCMMHAQVLVIWFMALNDTVCNFKKSFWDIWKMIVCFDDRKIRIEGLLQQDNKLCLLIILCRTSELYLICTIYFCMVDFSIGNLWFSCFGMIAPFHHLKFWSVGWEKTEESEVTPCSVCLCDSHSMLTPVFYP